MIDVRFNAGEDAWMPIPGCPFPTRRYALPQQSLSCLPYASAMKLRRLEFELLEKAYEDFERQVRDFLLHAFCQASTR